MDNRGLLDLIIARLPGLNAKDKICLCDAFHGEGDLINSSKGCIEKMLGHGLRFFWDIDTICSLAERDAKTARLRGLSWVSWSQAAYPPLAREMYDPPVVLFFRGCLPDPEKPLVAVVGTRHPSPQAAAQAFEISRDLGRQGISVVSGLALGIDAMAHRGNIEGGVPTFAVLGSGADEVYPKSNRVLARRILETGGAIISEYPPGTGPFRWNFPARNRIVSGLARGVLVIEAPESSGALITARFATEQGKDIWVASAGVDSVETDGWDRGAAYDRRGSAKLAENGVGIIAGAKDILKGWNIEMRYHDEISDSAEDCGGGKALAAKLARSFNIDL